MTRNLYACPTDNDGYPQCMGDGSTCGPDGQCVEMIAPGMSRVYAAWRRMEPEALALVALVNKGEEMTMDDKLSARTLLRHYDVDPDAITGGAG